MRIIDSKDVLHNRPAPVLTPTATFLQAEGAGNEQISIDGGDFSKRQKPLVLKDKAATKAAVRLRT